MNLRLFVVVAALALMALEAPAQEKSPPRRPAGGAAAGSGGGGGEFKTVRDKASYSFGMTMGTSLKKQGIDIDLDLLVRGLRDAAGNGKLALTEEQAMEAMQAFEKEVVAKQAEASKRFLADNKRRPGVKTTPTGLQYRILKAGKGAKPKSDDVVKVNFKASFVNGSEFQASGDQPFSTPVSDVIPGWQEALAMMEVGSKWQLVIPPELAYGEQGSPPAIGPNTALVFELELLEIGKPSVGAKRGPATVK